MSIEKGNPIVMSALLLNLVPLLTGLAMLGLKYAVGPSPAVLGLPTGRGFLFGLVVVGSALILVAYTPSEGRDWRIPAAGLLLILSLAEVILFAR